MKPVLVLMLLGLVAPAFGAATGLLSLDESKALANQSTLLLAQENFREAFAILAPHWPLAAAELQLLINETTEGWERVQLRFGKTQGVSYLGEQRLSPTSIRYSYLHHFEKGTGQWQITFQKYKDAWLVDGVAFVETTPPGA